MFCTSMHLRVLGMGTVVCPPPPPVLSPSGVDQLKPPSSPIFILLSMVMAIMVIMTLMVIKTLLKNI